MLLWALLGGFFVIAAAINDEKVSRFLFAGCFFIFAFQYGLGGDYFAYVEMYSNSSNAFGSKEPGFKLLISILKSSGFGPQMLYVVSAAAIYLFLVAGIKHYSISLGLPTAILYLLFYYGFFFESTSILRQAIAASIFFYATTFLDRRSPLIFICLTLIAISFHKSAALGILFMPLYLLNRNPRALLALLFVLSISIVVPVKNIIFNIVELTNISYVTYFSNEQWADRSASVYSKLITFVLLILIGYALLKEKSEKISLITIGMVVYVSSRVLLADLHIGHRVSFFFKPFLFLFLVTLLKTKLRSSRQFGQALLSIVFCLHMIVSLSVRYTNDPNFEGLKLNFTIAPGESSPIEILKGST